MAVLSLDQLQQAVQHAVATAAQQWQEAVAQMHQEIGTLRTQGQDAAQAVLPPQEVPTSLVDTHLFGKASISTAAQAGRIGALFSEAVRLLALRRRDLLDRCSTRR